MKNAQDMKKKVAFAAGWCRVFINYYITEKKFLILRKNEDSPFFRLSELNKLLKRFDHKPNLMLYKIENKDYVKKGILITYKIDINKKDSNSGVYSIFCETKSSAKTIVFKNRSDGVYYIDLIYGEPIKFYFIPTNNIMKIYYDVYKKIKEGADGVGVINYFEEKYITKNNLKPLDQHEINLKRKFWEN